MAGARIPDARHLPPLGPHLLNLQSPDLLGKPCSPTLDRPDGNGDVMASDRETPAQPPLSSRPGGGGDFRRHQLKRSLTELTSPVKFKSGHHARHSIHQHPQQHHLPHRKDRHRDDREPHTVHPGMIRHSLDTPRPDVMASSRRGSGMPPRGEDMSRVNSNQLSVQTTKTTKDEKLRKEIDRADHRVEGLKQSLGDLHTFSTTATRRLDETYYAVLEKTSTLQNTITALKELAEASRDIYGTFEKDSKALENDITGQLDALDHFEEQESRIESLQGRIRDGRNKIQALSGRVDIVRNRVENWERADLEWQNTTRRRLRVIWSSMFVVTLALITLFVAAKFWSSDSSGGGSSADAGGSMTRTLRHPSMNISRRVPVLGGGDGEVNFESLLRRGRQDAEERLHALDEL